MQDRRNNSQTFDNNFIDMVEILAKDEKDSCVTDVRLFNQQVAAVPFEDSISNLGSIGNI